MSVGNLKTNGNKGNNFPYQLGALQLLDAIAAGVAPPGGLATEATLVQVLSAIQNGKEFEQLLVIDLGGVGCPAACPTYIQIRIWNTTTHTFDPPIYYNAAGAVVVPIGPLQIVNPQYVLDNMLVQLTAINTDLDVALSTRASEATLLAVGTVLSNILTALANVANLDVALSTRNAEATQLLVRAAVEAINTKLTTVARVPSAVNVTAGVGGTTTAGVRSVSLWFRGANGSVGGVPVPNNAIMTFNAGAEEDTLNGIAYVRPTTGEARIIITYTT
jgi:hypothetical protein